MGSYRLRRSSQRSGGALAFLARSPWHASTEYAAEGFQVKHVRHVSVRAVLRTKGMRFRYDYDFGDNWRHDVLVERIKLLDAEDWVAPRCLDGRRACPPEDRGGDSGYYELLEALRDPQYDDQECVHHIGGGSREVG